MKQILKFFASYKFILSFTFLINVAVFALLSYYINSLVYWMVALVTFVVAAFALARSLDEPAYKTMWLLVIVILPLFGTILYLYIKGSNVSHKQIKNWKQVYSDSMEYLKQNEDVLTKLDGIEKQMIVQAKYVLKEGFPVYKNSYAKYLKSGEIFFKDLKEELKKARNFILLEFFIIKNGILWADILEILKQKAKTGVEIKIIYDDFGCLDNFKRNYFKNLKRFGIEAVVFNKIRPTLNQFINYRDHRKIAVIDGLIAYTGGVNIGDEYVNALSRFGRWCDSGVKVYGDAVFTHTVLFFQNYCRAKKIDYIDVNAYKKQNLNIQNSLSFVQPFGTGPVNKSPLARNNYVRMIYNAKKYLYITTPYLVIDGTIIRALKMAAQSGVDVRIVMPGVPDKKIVYILGRSYFKELMEEGIKIYEYTPGFIHSKIAVSDDTAACIGTINFDFRSLFLHFENAVMLYNDPCILDIKQDLENIFCECRLVSLEDIKKRKLYEKFFSKILRIFAPLM